jgi:hypothetical protein
LPLARLRPWATSANQVAGRAWLHVDC